MVLTGDTISRVPRTHGGGGRSFSLGVRAMRGVGGAHGGSERVGTTRVLLPPLSGRGRQTKSGLLRSVQHPLAGSRHKERGIACLNTPLYGIAPGARDRGMLRCWETRAARSGVAQARVQEGGVGQGAGHGPWTREGGGGKRGRWRCGFRGIDPTPYTLHPTLYTLHPTPYTLHPAPYTLHPTPYTLRPTPYTLHPKP